MGQRAAHGENHSSDTFVFLLVTDARVPKLGEASCFQNNKHTGKDSELTRELKLFLYLNSPPSVKNQLLKIWTLEFRPRSKISSQGTVHLSVATPSSQPPM